VLHTPHKLNLQGLELPHKLKFAGIRLTTQMKYTGLRLVVVPFRKLSSKMVAITKKRNFHNSPNCIHFMEWGEILNIGTRKCVNIHLCIFQVYL
jgi:hypothetical protein